MTGTSKSARIYTLYPTGGSFTNKSTAYRGKSLNVLATSIAQAYAICHKSIVATEPGEVGIVESYVRDRDPAGHQYWCGCYSHNRLTYHGMTITKMVKSMNDHINNDHRSA